MTLGFAGLVSRRSPNASMPARLRALWPLLALGRVHGPVLVRHRTLRPGNVIPYGAVPGLVDPRDRADAVRSRRALQPWPLLVWAAAWYALAKVFETFDLAVYRLTQALSGHTIKHVLAAGACSRSAAAAAAPRVPALHLRRRMNAIPTPAPARPNGPRRPRASWARSCAAWSARPSRTTA
jgi:hypothetical protein